MVCSQKLLRIYRRIVNSNNMQVITFENNYDKVISLKRKRTIFIEKNTQINILAGVSEEFNIK